MKEYGLTIKGNENSFTIPVKAMTLEELLELGEPLETVFLCVKAQHTGGAVNSFKHLLTPDATVVSFQNGLCEQEIANLIGKDRTVGCFINLFADYLEPGLVQYGGVGSVYIGELDGTISARVQNLVACLSALGTAKATDNIWGYLWGKLAYGAILTATALTDETIADVLEPERNRKMLMDLAAEVLAVADYLQIRPMGFDDWEPSLVYPIETRDLEKINLQVDTLIQRLRTYTKTKTGIWRDLAVRKRKTEVPYHLTPVIEVGEAAGIKLPLTESVLLMIREVEEGKREMSLSNLEILHDLYQKNRVEQASS